MYELLSEGHANMPKFVKVETVTSCELGLLKDEIVIECNKNCTKIKKKESDVIDKGVTVDKDANNETINKKIDDLALMWIEIQKGIEYDIEVKRIS